MIRPKAKATGADGDDDGDKEAGIICAGDDRLMRDTKTKSRTEDAKSVETCETMRPDKWVN